MDRRPHALVLLACAAIAGCGVQAKQVGPGAKPPDLVKYESPITMTVEDYEEFPGRTDAIFSVEVRSRVSGYLVDVDFKDGDEITTTEKVLFRIDKKPFDADVHRAKAALGQAEAHAKRLNNEYLRAKALYDRGISISREEYDRYAFDHAEAESAQSTAMANLEMANLNLTWTQVTAPITGRLGRRLVDPGNLVKADETVLTTIVSQNPIYIYFDVHEQAMLRIRRMIQEGKISARKVPVKIGLSDELGYPHQGEVDFTDNRVDQNTGTLRFRAQLDNRDGLFTPGLFVRVKLPIGQPHPAVMVRELALISDQGDKKVWVLEKAVDKEGKPQFLNDKDGKPTTTPLYKPRRVKLEMTSVIKDGFQEVREGLKPGQMVVVSGIQKIRDKPVQAAPFNPETDAVPGTAAKTVADAEKAPLLAAPQPDAPHGGPLGGAVPPAARRSTPRTNPAGNPTAAPARPARPGR